LLVLLVGGTVSAQDATQTKGVVKADGTDKTKTANKTGSSEKPKTNRVTNKTDEGSAEDLTEAEKAKRAKANEGWLVDGVFAVATGLEGGDPGNGTVTWSRARTRVLAGIDLRTDESSSNGYGFYGFTEIEKRTSLGGEIRFQHWWTPTIAFHGGFLGTLFPETMIGIGAGARFGFPIGKKATLFLEPGFAAFPIGSDLPGNSVLIWGTLAGGVGVAL
jgi:hypothetical protein